MRIIAFGTYQSEAHPRIKVLIEGLRSFGHEVVEINEPLALSTSDRVRMLKAPHKATVLLTRLAKTWRRLIRRGRTVARERQPDAVLVGYMGHFDIHLARRIFPGTPIVLDHLVFAAGTARDRGASSHVLLELLRGLDRWALRAADCIVVDTAEHAGLVPERLRRRVVVCPVGADAAWFDAGAEVHPVHREVAIVRTVFYGVYTPLQGTPTIGRALERLKPELESGRLRVTMIGAGQELEITAAACGATRNLVDWIPWVDPPLLPRLVAQHDVALGIFGTTPKARGVVPNKVYQGAAARCAVITSDTEPQRRTLGAAAVLVPPGDDAALARALTSLVNDPQALAGYRGAARALAEATFTSRSVVTPLVQWLEALVSQGSNGKDDET